MARSKNALRKHYISKIPEGSTEANWLQLARWITSITDDSDENTEEAAYYDGDGTPESNVVSIAERWSIEGTYDPNDPAQALVASLKRETGDGRKLMHKIEFTDGTTAVGRATVTDVKAGGGDASEYETFSCTISYDKTPEIETPSRSPMAAQVDVKAKK